jgi:hypothetical protein
MYMGKGTELVGGFVRMRCVIGTTIVRKPGYFVTAVRSSLKEEVKNRGLAWESSRLGSV